MRNQMIHVANFLYRPNLFDRHVIAAVLICGAALAMVVWPLTSFDYLLYVPRFGASDSVFGMVVVLGLLFSFVFSFTSPRATLAQRLFLGIAMVLACSTFVWAAKLCDVWQNQKNGQGPSNDWIFVAIVFVLGLGIYHFELLAKNSASWLYGNVNRFRLTRVGIMAIIAALLGIVVVGRNILDTSGASFDSGFYIQEFTSNSFSWQFRLMVVAISMLAILFPIHLTRTMDIGWKRELRLAAYVIVLAGLTSVIGFLTDGFELNIGLGPVLLVGTFWIGHLLIGFDAVAKPVSPNDSADDDFSTESSRQNKSNLAASNGEEKRKRWFEKIPTHWSVLAVACFVLPALIVSWYDPRFLFGASQKADWELARFSRKIANVPNNELKMALHGNSGIYLYCEFSDSTKDNVLEPFQNDTMISALFVENPKLNVDYSFLPDSVGRVDISDGGVGVSQLADLGKVKRNHTLINVRIENDVYSQPVFDAGSFLIRTDQRGAFDVLFSNLQFSSTQLFIKCDMLTLTDREIRLLQEVVAKSGRFGISDMSDSNFFRQKTPQNQELFWKMFLTSENEVKFYADFPEMCGEDLLAAIICSRRRGSYGIINKKIFSPVNRDGEEKTNSLLFFDEGNSNTNLYCHLHDGVANLIAANPEIQVLSLDNEWTWHDGLTHPPMYSNLFPSIGNLSKLRELYLPQLTDSFGRAKSQFSNIKQLANLTNLKTIQFDSWTASRLGKRLSNMVNLERVIMIGAPDPKTEKQLQQLPKLQELFIVDTTHEYTSVFGTIEEAEKSVAQQYGNTLIRILESIDDLQHLVPQEFRDHQKRVHEMLWKKHLGDWKLPNIDE